MSNVLIIGSGPVGVQLAQICKRLSIKDIDMVGRATTSEKSLAVYNGYQHDGMFTVTTQNGALIVSLQGNSEFVVFIKTFNM